LKKNIQYDTIIWIKKELAGNNEIEEVRWQVYEN